MSVESIDLLFCSSLISARLKATHLYTEELVVDLGAEVVEDLYQHADLGDPRREGSEALSSW